jgi:hypothetical protein
MTEAGQFISEDLGQNNSNGLNSKLPAALTQIQQIAKFEKQWSTVPSKIYEQALLDNKLQNHWHTSVEVVVPKDFYPKEKNETFMTVPKEEILRPRTWKFGGKHLPQELSTLSDTVHGAAYLPAMPPKPEISSAKLC